KYANHDLVTRRRTLPRPTADGRVVGDVARDLLAEVPAIERRGVRLTGVSLSGLGDAAAPRQLDLGEADAERGGALGAVQDRIAARFGPGALMRGVRLEEEDERHMTRTDPRTLSVTGRLLQTRGVGIALALAFAGALFGAAAVRVAAHMRQVSVPDVIWDEGRVVGSVRPDIQPGDQLVAVAG